ncbi:hypothetical protein HJC23_000209 [Cyclotella cryptica]|uniref:Guanylate kinase-like domain-containing protein n=1 Tax=Cyclotella cryptica TaxID=29204 RepID=A0ABD3QDR4_9STRA
MATYTPPEDAEKTKPSSPKLPQPKIGDIVRYYDMDGGRADGQTLVGKISLIQRIQQPSSSTTNTSPSDGTNRWLLELTPLQDVGDGYYAEYPRRKRRQATLRKLEEVAPLAASFVRSEDAFKIPMERGTNVPMPYASGYDVVNYEGPTAIPVNGEIVQRDGENYNEIKASLLRNAALAGLVGTVVADLSRGTQDAVIYAAGAAAGVAYLFFLGIKTDTLGSPNAKLGSNVSNLRFVLPVLVLAGVALNNVLRGDENPVVTNGGMFSTVTPEQFGAAMIGFLTYRVPLFVSQLAPVISESATDMVPGSAGMAIRMAAEARKRGVDVSELNDKVRGSDDSLVTVLLVSGPEGTGKTTLVNRLLEEDDRFVRPILEDRIADGMKFERYEQRDEFLSMDETGRYGLLKEGVLKAAEKAAAAAENSQSQKVVVVDADVPLAKKLVNLAGARLVGVWVGLDSLEKFEERLMAKLKSGAVPLPEGETEESLLRAKIGQVVKDIEFGVVSGIFEFTILNDDIEESMRELKDAASYCFK